MKKSWHSIYYELLVLIAFIAMMWSVIIVFQSIEQISQVKDPGVVKGFHHADGSSFFGRKKGL